MTTRVPRHRDTSPGSTIVGKQITCSVGSEELWTRSRVTRFAPVLVTVYR